MSWPWIALAGIGGPLVVLAMAATLLYLYVRVYFFQHVIRIFLEKPLFIIPRGQPVPGAEEVTFVTDDGFKLHGCYFRSGQSPRRGVILFGLEFGSNCWACLPYCEHLIASGFDVFTFEPRNCGESEHQPDYEPLQWVTAFDVKDFQAAVTYLRARPDADQRGIGFFGISKGGGAGLVAASRDSYFRAFVTDGIFATHLTMVPYMQKWVSIYSRRPGLRAILPGFAYSIFGRHVLRIIQHERHCHFPHLERAIRRLSPRPIFMIHGGGDTYIKPDMAESLFDMAGEPKQFWMVDGAKHNQAIMVAGDEYRARVLDFFMTHLANQASVLLLALTIASPPGS